MTFKCIVVDDEELARELLEIHLAQLGSFELVALCSSAIEAHEVLQKEKIDLMFLDIEMPVLKGTDFLRNLHIKPKVILTTAYREYALEGYELNVIDYLLKPIVFSRFFKAIEKFKERIEKIKSPVELDHHIFIKSNKKNIKIVLDDVLYIESLKDYIKIHFTHESIIFKSGITTFFQRLDRRFLRVHRSFVVSIDKITAFTKKGIEIYNIEIPIGEYYKEEVLKRLQNT